MTTETPAIAIQKIDGDATYTQDALASVLGISTRQLIRWRKNRRMKFPRAFLQGKTPCWRGRVIIDWQDRRQQEAMA